MSLDYVLICEDDHIFTKEYSTEKLYSAIAKSITLNADVLLGSVSWFNHVLQVNPQLFWIDRFNGTQFMLIFKKFYRPMLETAHTKQWLRSAEVRKLLKISAGTLQNLRINGTLPFKKIGSIVYYAYNYIVSVLEEGGGK